MSSREVVTSCAEISRSRRSSRARRSAWRSAISRCHTVVTRSARLRWRSWRFSTSSCAMRATSGWPPSEETIARTCASSVPSSCCMPTSRVSRSMIRRAPTSSSRARARSCSSFTASSFSSCAGRTTTGIALARWAKRRVPIDLVEVLRLGAQRHDDRRRAVAAARLLQPPRPIRVAVGAVLLLPRRAAARGPRRDGEALDDGAEGVERGVDVARLLAPLRLGRRPEVRRALLHHRALLRALHPSEVDERQPAGLERAVGGGAARAVADLREGEGEDRVRARRARVHLHRPRHPVAVAAVQHLHHLLRRRDHLRRQPLDDDAPLARLAQVEPLPAAEEVVARVVVHLDVRARHDVPRLGRARLEALEERSDRARRQAVQRGVAALPVVEHPSGPNMVYVLPEPV